MDYVQSTFHPSAVSKLHQLRTLFAVVTFSPSNFDTISETFKSTMAPELPPADLQLVLSKIKNSESLIVSIITYQFPARDLYKLCPPDVSEEASLYKTPSSVLIPLEVYFAILSEYLGSFSQFIIKGALAYFKHLQDLIDEYEWSRVFEYHCAYFDQQVDKLRSAGPLHYPIEIWVTPDYQLMGQLDPTPELDASAQLKIIRSTENPIQVIT
jgi:hypothetical protein